MKYVAYHTYEITESELAALRCYYEAARDFGAYRVPIGTYRGQSCSDHLPMLAEVVADPLEGTREVWSRLRVVPDPMNAIQIIEAAKRDAAFDFNSPGFDHLWHAEQYLTQAIEAEPVTTTR
jgi:hypothetical protein